MIKKLMLLILCSAILFTTEFACAGSYSPMKIFTEPPKTPYKELGVIAEMKELNDVESRLAISIGNSLKKKARDLGANAIIIGPITRVPRVFRRADNQGDDSNLHRYMLTIRLRIEAMAIMLEP